MSETYRNRNGGGRKTEFSRASASQTSASRTSAARTGGAARSSRLDSSDRILASRAGNSGFSRQGARSTKRVSSVGTSARRRARRRNQRPDFAKLLLIIIGILIVLICLAVGLKSCSSGTNGEGDPAESTSMPETEMEAEITINGVSVHGLTQTQAKEQVMKSIGWGMTVVYGEETKELPNLMEGNVDAVIAEAFASGTAKDYALSTEGLEEAVTAQVDELASQWDVQPKNGSISSYDASTDQFVFSDEENGSLIDRDSLKNDILAAMAAADYTAEITASATVVEPEITRDEARENFQRIGTFTTTTTANKDRNENIRLAAAAINGVIVQPGEEFSFNQTTGNRTTEKGYRPAGAYQNGVLVEEPGGGVCQVSSTLYNAVVFSGLKTTERHAHSYEPSYVTPGEDAMVSYDGYSGPDMKFINNSQTAVGLKTSFSNQKLTISVYGNPILEEGVTLSMRSEKTAELDPPAPVYEEDPTLEPGVEKVVKQPVMGSRWVTYLVTKENGTVVNEVLLHNSTYNGKAATIRRNTSGSVLSTEAETSSGESLESSGAAGESESVMDSSAAETTAPQGPASPADQTTGSQNIGPGFEKEPSSVSEGPGGSGGPAATESTTAGTVVTMPQTQPSSQLGPGNTGGPQPVETQPAQTAGPSEVGLIPPIGS